MFDFCGANIILLHFLKGHKGMLAMVPELREVQNHTEGRSQPV